MPEPDRRETLLAEYSHVSSTFQLLTEVRFKLLAFLPLATGAAVAVINLRRVGVPGLVVALFGLVVTVALVAYNKRNDQLYDTLVRRAAAIERSLGLPEGAFATRPRPWLSIDIGRLSWPVDHRSPVATIYSSSIALWLFGAFAAIGDLVRRSWWVELLAALVAVAVTWAGTLFVTRREEVVYEDLKRWAEEAVQLAENREPRDLLGDCRFLVLCQRLSGRDEETVRSRIGFFLCRDAAETSYYLGAETGLQAASRFVAAITDLAPGWLFDCASARHDPPSLPSRPLHAPPDAP
jgi:hypothetical protein